MGRVVRVVEESQRRAGDWLAVDDAGAGSASIGPGSSSDSWDRIVEDNQNYIFRLAFHLAGNIHEAEDVTQEAFMRAFEHRETFRGDASMRTWLSRIAVNVYLASRKRSSRVKAAGVAGEEDLNGMRYDEMARVLGITLGAVKTRLHRARKAMRDLLVESGCSGLVKGGRCTCEEVLDL